jgi:hypothetical protein
MSNLTRFTRARSAALLAVVFAFAAIPAAAQAAPVNLATASPFVVLGGQAATNTGTSVLNGELGVAPGTSLPGFDTAVVNGATHNNDAVANQAQADLTTPNPVAAGQATTADLSNTDLGNRTLTAGNYKYSSSAQLTGPLTLDGQNNPDAQFVFQIASQLTTASASSVVLINGASPCNVYWQIGSSAVLGSTTAFQGNVMALTSISLNNGATVIGRLLARNGAVTLINNVINGAQCGASTSEGGDTLGPGGTTPGGGSGSAGGGSGSSATAPGTNGTAVFVPAPRAQSTPRRPGSRGTPQAACTAGFRASIRGRMIKRVVFSLDGNRLSSRVKGPFAVYVKVATPGKHVVKARVTFKDATRAKTLSLRYRACAAAVLSPRRGPSVFTG